MAATRGSPGMGNGAWPMGIAARGSTRTPFFVSAAAGADTEWVKTAGRGMLGGLGARAAFKKAVLGAEVRHPSRYLPSQARRCRRRGVSNATQGHDPWRDGRTPKTPPLVTVYGGLFRRPQPAALGTIPKLLRSDGEFETDPTSRNARQWRARSFMPRQRAWFLRAGSRIEEAVRAHLVRMRMPPRVETRISRGPGMDDVGIMSDEEHQEPAATGGRRIPPRGQADGTIWNRWPDSGGAG